MPTRNKAQSDLIATTKFDPLVSFESAFSPLAPWDSIVDFATHRSFCNQRLYPRQLTLLKLIYLETENMTAYDLDVIEQWRQGFMDTETPEGVQEDIWTRVEYLKARGYRHFPHIEAIIGRRGSKGKIGGILGTEKLAYMFSLDNWQSHYGVSPNKDGYLSVVATNSIQAKKFQFADIRETVESCKYLQPHIAESKGYELAIRTPADVRHIAYLHKNKMPIDHQIASLHAVAMSSNSTSGRGATGFANFFDEFAHMITGTGSQRSSEEVYEAYQPSLDQFGQDSLTYIPSSPFTMVGHFFSLYEQGRVLMSEYDPDTGTSTFVEKTTRELGLSEEDVAEKLIETTANPEMLVVQLPSWGLYEDWKKSPKLGGPVFKRPIQAYDERMMRYEKSNPQKFAVERRSQFASVLDAFLDPKKVEAMFDPVEWRTPAKLAAQDRGRIDRRYYCHIDPGLTNANFALCIGHTEDAAPDEEGDVWPHVIIDYLKVWKPEDWEDHTINYVQVQRDIAELLRKFPSMVEFSADQWNCQVGSTLVPTEHGLLRLDELVGDGAAAGEIVDLSARVSTQRGPAVAAQGYHKGEATVRRITTKLGNVVEATPEHRLWVRKAKDERWHADKPWGFEHVRDIEVGDWLALRRNTLTANEYLSLTEMAYWDSRYTSTLTDEVGEALGMLVAEGDYGQDDFVRLGNSDDEFLERYRSLMEKSFGHDGFGGSWKSTTTDTFMGKWHYGWVRKQGKVARLLTELGLTGVSTSKVVPWAIRQSPASVIRAFLRGYFEGDGGVCFGREGDVWLEATTTSEEIASTVHQLLATVGVWSIKWSGTYRYKGEEREQWRIKMYGQDLLDFADLIGFSCSRKQRELESAVSTVIGGGEVSRRSKNERHGDERWVRVTSIEDGITTDCYDLSVPGPETYIANGVVSHNSAGMLAALREEFGGSMTIRQETFTDSANQERMDRFKSALNLGWIHSYRDNFYDPEEGRSLLELECKFLQKTGKRVDKQEFGPVTTKDLFDATNVVVDRLLKDTLDRWQAKMLGVHTPAIGSTNVAGLRSGRELDRLNSIKMGGSRPHYRRQGEEMTAREKLRAQSEARSFNRSQRNGGYAGRLRGRR